MDTVLKISIDSALLREARERVGLSQVEAGALCGVSDRQISHIECGTKQPSSEVLVRMCAAYRIELSQVTTNPHEAASKRKPQPSRAAA